MSTDDSSRIVTPTAGIPSGGDAGDGVEGALARAIDRASHAGRFDVVAQLARELEARRLASADNVVLLGHRDVTRKP